MALPRRAKATAGVSRSSLQLAKTRTQRQLPPEETGPAAEGCRYSKQLLLSDEERRVSCRQGLASEMLERPLHPDEAGLQRQR